MADMEKNVAANEYNAAEIQVLEGLEPCVSGRVDVYRFYQCQRPAPSGL